MNNKIKLMLLATGLILGLAVAVIFNQTMAFTNTESFCLSCHNHQIPYREYKQSKHFFNTTGISPSCSDCHVPHEFGPKLWRKVVATKELFAHIAGVIDNDEKYLAHRDQMKVREIARLKANDSAECRYCHDVKRMDFAAQSSPARNAHIERSKGKTCIDCHVGVAHSPVAKDDDFDF